MVVRYGSTLAVDRLSFTAHRGEVLALLGPNGAGKTSTVEALEGYRTVSAGRLRVLGLDPGRDHAALVPRIGVMLQKGGVYPMLGPAQVLHLFAAYYDDPEDPDTLLDQVGLGHVRRTPWRRLSGGEQQRLSLALALVGKPEVLFLDEPTAGVDPEGRIVVRELIAAQRDKGLCVLLTTHELGEAERLADRVVIVDRGRLLAEGTPAELSSGTADGSVRFSTEPGIDTVALASALAATAARARPSPRNAPAPTGSACRRARRHHPWWRCWPVGWPNATSPSVTCAPVSRSRRPTWPSPGRGTNRPPTTGRPRVAAGAGAPADPGDGADAATRRPGAGRAHHAVHQRRERLPHPRASPSCSSSSSVPCTCCPSGRGTRSTSWCRASWRWP